MLSGTWAAASVGRLLPAAPAIQTTFYLVGLVLGLATVGAWLYFCSAYTGHDYHHNSTIRTLAATVFLVIVSVKLTNPLHHLYFTTTTTTTPFPHLVIELNAVHWVVTGLAYALAAVGFYLLYEQFTQSQFDTTPLSVLVVVTAIPAVVDILAYTEAMPSVLLKFNFEPIGVAVFAIGTLYIVDDTFLAIPQFWPRRVLDHLDQAVVVLDRKNRIRDYNPTATAWFPELADAITTPLDAAVPALASASHDQGNMLERDQDGATSYYRIRTVPLTNDTDTVRGRVLIAADVTDIERQRRTLQRHAEQFDDFAEAITHELRNTVTLVDGYLDLAADSIAEGSDHSAEVPLQEVSEALDRMRSVIGDLTTLARYSQPLDSGEVVALEAVVTTGHAMADVDGVTPTVETTTSVIAGERRLEELFAAVFDVADATAATEVTVAVEDDTIVVTTDGEWLSGEAIEQAFAYGEPVPSADTGMALPNIQMLARGLGWETTIDDAYTEGIRLRIEAVERA